MGASYRKNTIPDQKLNERTPVLVRAVRQEERTETQMFTIHGRCANEVRCGIETHVNDGRRMRFECLDTLARQVQDMCKPIVRTECLHSDVSADHCMRITSHQVLIRYDKSRRRILLE